MWLVAARGWRPAVAGEGQDEAEDEPDSADDHQDDPDDLEVNAGNRRGDRELEDRPGCNEKERDSDRHVPTVAERTSCAG